MARRSSSDLEGVLLVDKPAGWTSHDVVARVRGLTGQRRAGHTGTLDPAATGLLVLCLGTATRLVEYMTGHRKRYEGLIRLGMRTTTDDAEGEVLEERPVQPGWEDQLPALARRFTGEQDQLPPAYSAISVGGRRAYDLARAGEAPDLAPRLVTIHSLELSPAGERDIAVGMICGAGTYVRSLARDLGEALGCGAHLAGLRRTAAGRFTVDEAWTLDELAALATHGLIPEALLPADEGVVDCEAAIVAEGQARDLANGRLATAEGAFRASKLARIYDASGSFVGVGEVGESGQIRGKKVFVRGN